MSIQLSEEASNAILTALADLLDGGLIELQQDNGRVLAVLRLSDPATMPAIGGELEFHDITEEDAALGQGIVTRARVVGGNGGEVFSCTVGDQNSGAVIQLNTTKIFAGGPVRLTSLKLAVP